MQAFHSDKDQPLNIPKILYSFTLVIVKTEKQNM